MTICMQDGDRLASILSDEEGTGRVAFLGTDEAVFCDTEDEEDTEGLQLADDDAVSSDTGVMPAYDGEVVDSEVFTLSSDLDGTGYMAFFDEDESNMDLETESGEDQAQGVLEESLLLPFFRVEPVTAELESSDEGVCFHCENNNFSKTLDIEKVKRDHLGPPRKIIGRKNRKFECMKLIGKGSFGVVFGGRHKGSGSFVAIKVEPAPKSKSLNLLTREYRIYDKITEKIKNQKLGGSYTHEGIPKIAFFGEGNEKPPQYRYLVMEYLGQSLGHRYAEQKFSLKTILLIGLEIVKRLEVFHKCTFIHRDIKPENFMCGNNEAAQGIIYIIDLGLCKRYIDPSTGKHLKMRGGKSLVGTIRYASIACHQGLEQGRKDDLESVGYMLAYFQLKHLPWQGIGRAERDDKINQKILELKKSFDKHLADVQAPNVFREYLANVRKLEYEEEPDYDALKNMFLEEMKSRNIACDMKFDWMDSAKARKSND